jgi:NDP-sugar pyrophosphorylase family protein
MPIGDYPILEILVRQLSGAGINHITLAVNHQAELIRSYFENGRRWNVTIDYSQEKIPLGTMGPLKLINRLPENFLVMNGDVLSDLDFKKFLSTHESEKNLFSIASFHKSYKSEYGVLTVAKTGELLDFTEKPTISHAVSMGVYALNRSVTDYIASDVQFGFDDLMKEMIRRELQVKVLTHQGYWRDIGTPSDYETAQIEFAEHKEKLLR